MSLTKKAYFILGVTLSLVFLLTSCDGMASTPTPTPSSTLLPAPKPVLQAEVVFQVDIPSNTPENPEIFLDLVDEITGIAINPDHRIMEQLDKYRYATRVSIPIGSVVKYRYGREGNPTKNEFTPNGKQVRYRLVKVSGPVVVSDIVSAWTDVPFKEKFGRIDGQVLDLKTGKPIANILIAAGGAHTFSSSDGRFLIEGLPVGTHQITAYSLDGAFQVFQQGAMVASDTATPATLRLTPSALVKVTFLAKTPLGSVRGMPIRLIGNIYTLGNTFADLGGGISTVAARAPLMSMQSDGTYSLSLVLPAGLDLRYKYSLGDGFWNSEHQPNGAFKERQLIVPDKDVIVNDSIETWQTANSAPITFTVKVPPNTPVTDTVSIQFNPYGWTEPVPMWSLGNNQWMYVLYSPLGLVNSVGYRYCRNDQCGAADDDATKGANTQGRIFTSSRLAQNFQDEVKKWSWWQPAANPTTVVAPEAQKRGANFVAGIEFSSHYQPGWQPQWNTTFQTLKDINANWAFITPTWSYTRQIPPVLEPVPGKDMLWHDAEQMMGWAKEKGLKIAVFPNTNLPASDLWGTKTKDNAWWQTWFDRYEAYLVNFADLAEKNKAEILILGEPSSLPAVSGVLPNGAQAGLPSSAIERWKKIISGVRGRYKGAIYWAVSYTEAVKQPPSFAGDVDGLYLLWNAPLSSSASASDVELVKEIGQIFEKDIIKIKDRTKKPLIIGLNIGSYDGAVKGCVPLSGTCLPVSALDQPGSDIPSIALDLQEQASIYNAFLVAINQSSWVDGIVSRQYYPPAALQDKSASIHGKPASDVVWYWYQKLTSK